MTSVLIVGCGFVGEEVVRQMRREGNPTIYALTRTVARSDHLRALGVEPIVGHWHDVSTLQKLPKVEVVLVSVPHRPDVAVANVSEADTHAVGLANLQQFVPKGYRKWIYLSTTGVYGEAHDEVDERTPVSPTRIGPQIAVTGERYLQNEFDGGKFAIIRLAGIYGPGRIPLAEKLRSGEPLQVPQEGWLNLVHVHDIAEMIIRAMKVDLPDSLYVFSDGQPVPRLEFYKALAQLCGVAEPKFQEPDPNSSRAQRAGKKRVNPTRLVEALDFQFRFPSYREGLADCLKARGS